MDPYYYINESGSAVQLPKEEVDKVGAVSKEDILINSTVEKAIKITKDDAKAIQNEKDVQMEVPNAATKNEMS